MPQGPLADNILVRPLPPEEAEGGMITPGTQQERPRRGVVVAVGPGRLMENGLRVGCVLQPGEMIEFPGYAGNDKALLLKLGPGSKEEELLCMREEEAYYSHGFSYTRGLNPPDCEVCDMCGALGGIFHQDYCPAYEGRDMEGAPDQQTSPLHSRKASL